jgi:hypothetical protein
MNPDAAEACGGAAGEAAPGVTSSAVNSPGSRCEGVESDMTNLPFRGVTPHVGEGNLLTQFSDKSGRTFGEEDTGHTKVGRPHPLYWQYDFAISRPWVASLRDGPWKLMADAELDKYELYNLVDDVGESKNLAEKNVERVRRMVVDIKSIYVNPRRGLNV